MTFLPECFTKNQQMSNGKKSHLLNILDPTAFLSFTLKKYSLILGFSAILNSHATTVATAENFDEFADEIIKFMQNLFSGCSHIDIHVKLVVIDKFLI